MYRPSSKARILITSFANAVRQDAGKGGGDPDSVQEIGQMLREERAALNQYISDLEALRDMHAAQAAANVSTVLNTSAVIDGQRLLFNGREIVVALPMIGDRPNGNMRRWIRRASGIEQYVDPINLKPLPSGQL